MPPPSWLTALCGPAAPIPTSTLLLVGPARSPTRSSAALPAGRPRAGSRCWRPTAASAWPTRSPRGADPATTIGAGRRGARRRAGPTRVVSAGASGAIVAAAVIGTRPAARRAPSGAGRDPARRRTARWSCSTSAPACRSARSTWSSTPRSAPATPGSRAGRRRSPASACSRSAPSPAKATGSAGPPTPRCAPHPLAGAALRRPRRGPRRRHRRPRRRRRDRRVHRKRPAQGHRGGAGRGRPRVPADRRARGPPRCSASPARSWSATAPPTGADIASGIALAARLGPRPGHAAAASRLATGRRPHAPSRRYAP